MITKAVPLSGEEATRMHGQPVDVGCSSGTERTEHECADAVGMALCIRGAQHRSPGEPEHDPAVDLQMLAELLDVGQVMIHVDAGPVDVRL